MKALRNYLDKIKPNFEEGGKFHAFQSVFDGFETFLFVPSTTSKSGTHIHDAIDSKRIMSMVVIALVPALLFGMYNVGYQHFTNTGATGSFIEMFAYGFLAVLPKIIVSYVVGLGIEFVVAQWKKEEIQEGFLVTGILIPMICPPETPLWMMAVATAFSVIFVKEVFGGTGYNIFNVALVARAVLFFGYPASMSGDKVFVATGQPFGFGPAVPDGFSCATPLGQLATSTGDVTITGVTGAPITAWDAFAGFMPGCFGETSVICILIGAALLLLTRIASWRVMLSAVAGGLLMGWIAWQCQTPLYPTSTLNPFEQLLFGGFAFATVFMATDPVTGARTNIGKWIYGFLFGIIAVIIRTYNNGYPEGAMMAVLLMNAFAPLIDWCVVAANKRRRRLRQTSKAVQS